MNTFNTLNTKSVYFYTTIESMFKEIAKAKVLTFFEPIKITLPKCRIGQARYIARLLSFTEHDKLYKFPNLYSRNTTLAGAYFFLSHDHPKEYLLTFFGQRKSKDIKRPALFAGYHMAHGIERKVYITAYCLKSINDFLLDNPYAEILIVHNHPDHHIKEIIAQLIGWEPTPSEKDRSTMIRFKIKTHIHNLFTGHSQNVRFYLVERGGLKEFTLPPSNLFINIFKVLFTKNTQSSS